MNIEQLLGQTVDFFGVDNNVFCVRPTSSATRLAFEAVEDEDDGYRSMLEDLCQVQIKGHIFFREPVAKVIVERDQGLEGYRLVDAETLHVWLRVGTDREDNYYPCFRFEYDPPKESKIGTGEPYIERTDRVEVVGFKVYLDGTFVVQASSALAAEQVARNVRVALANARS